MPLGERDSTGLSRSGSCTTCLHPIAVIQYYHGPREAFLAVLLPKLRCCLGL